MNKKIQDAKSFGDPVQLSHGTYHNIAVTFTDGSKGIALAKSQTPWYSPGTDCVVEVTGKTAKGYDKLKISKIEQQGQPARQQGSSYNSEGARVGMCVSKALESVLPMLVGNIKDNVDFWDTMGLALIKERAASLIDICKELESGVSKKEEVKEEKKEDDDEIPF